MRHSRLVHGGDTADLNDPRAFATPEMFATSRLDLQYGAGKAQQTDVVKMDAQVLDAATEADAQVVSVRFHGLIREDKDGGAMPFDEVWRVVSPPTAAVSGPSPESSSLIDGE